MATRKSCNIHEVWVFMPDLPNTNEAASTQLCDTCLDQMKSKLAFVGMLHIIAETRLAEFGIECKPCVEGRTQGAIGLAPTGISDIGIA